MVAGVMFPLFCRQNKKYFYYRLFLKDNMPIFVPESI